MGKTIGICGYGYSGSGAVVDLLRGCPNVNYIDCGELTISYLPDGLEDLEHSLFEGHSRFLSCDIALKRFIERIDKYTKSNCRFDKNMTKKWHDRTIKYIEQLTQVEWIGYWKYDYQETFDSMHNYIRYRINDHFYNLFKRILRGGTLYPERKMRLSINPQEFETITIEYVEELLVSLGYLDGKINILDQLYSADNPSKSFKYFPNPCAIIVDRDPRDVYILSKKVLSNHSLWIPTNNVKDFVKYYKSIRDNENKENQKGVFRLNFEELVYDFENTKSLIASFIGIEPNTLTDTYFKPEVSINNTQLFENVDLRLKDDIKYIEEHLGEYLVDFSQYALRPNRETNVF